MVETNVKDKAYVKLLSQLQPHLVAGERPAVVIRGGSNRPMTDLLVVTDARVVAFWMASLEQGAGPKFEVHANQLASVDTSWRHVEITGLAGERLKFGAGKEDVARAAGAALRLKGGMLDSAVAEQLSAAQEARAATETAWASVPAVGAAINNRVNKATWKALRAAANDAEVPLFIITGDDGAGVLAAFSDRCMIVKAGVMTGLMAGSLGGSRQATFHYSQITGVEYNAGMINGVLEVLTASYNGTANRDFWRGTTAGRNADSNDPYTLSNTLPLSKAGYKNAQAHVNELRRLVGESKQVHVVVNAPSSGGGASLPEELAKLGELRAQGILDEDEFAAAKKAVMARFS